MERLFVHSPEAIENTVRIAEACDFSLDSLKTSLPTFSVPQEETPFSYLYQLTYEGAKERYRPMTPEAAKQIAHELDIIQRLNLAGYFLIVWDVARFCREKGILCQGRGSAANSAVCYCLGITAVDPVKLNLLFGRGHPVRL
jgi:error-prone DNA polymerase